MRTLKRFFTIIGLLDQAKELRLHEIADSVGMDRSTVFRFLQTALEFGYLNKDKETSKYSLGYKFLDIASKITDNLDLRKIVHPHLMELERITGETIHLTIFERNTVVYIDKVESEKPVRMYSRIGNVAPMYCTAVGKAMLAFQSQELIEEILNSTLLRAHTPNTITDKNALQCELQNIREKGYAIDNQEHEHEICCIAGPLWDSRRKVKAAISISAVKSRMNMDQLLQYTPILTEKCLSISKQLGYSEDEQSRT